MLKHSRRRKVAYLLVLIILALLIWVYYARHADKPSETGPSGHQQKSVPVAAVHVQTRDVPVYLSAIGTVVSPNTVNLRPEVSGRLLTLDFTEGANVSKGDVLAKIDPRTYQAAFDEAKARVQQDQAELATARSDLARSLDLVKKNYVSKQDVETQRNAVSRLQAAIATDKAALESTQINLDDTAVKAPISGLAGIRQVDVGNVLQTSDVIVTLNQISPVNVMFSLPAKNFKRVRDAQQKTALDVSVATREDNQELATHGRLQVIDNHIDADSGTFALKAEFANTDTTLWPGQFVNVKLKVATVKDGLIVPVEAVERGPDGEYVYVLEDDDSVAIRDVQVAGEVDATHVLIDHGLEAGERIVSEGQFRLRPGTHVKVVGAKDVPEDADRNIPADTEGED